MIDKKEKEPQVQTAVRVPESWLVRLDRLAEKMSRPGMPVTRTEVLRLAMYRGIEGLERESAGKR